jgi:ribosomal protein L13E
MVRVISPIIENVGRVREGKGFSIEELKSAGISPGEAKKLGIPYDNRRRSNYEGNVEILKEYIEEAKKAGLSFSAPKVTGKRLPGRVYKGKTSAGQRMRNLNHRK